MRHCRLVWQSRKLLRAFASETGADFALQIRGTVQIRHRIFVKAIIIMTRAVSEATRSDGD